MTKGQVEAMRGFIRRYVVHAEWHPGYRPRFSIRRAPRAGDRVTDGDETGTLRPCCECSTVGFLFVPDRRPATMLGWREVPTDDPDVTEIEPWIVPDEKA